MTTISSSNSFALLSATRAGRTNRCVLQQKYVISPVHKIISKNIKNISIGFILYLC